MALVLAIHVQTWYSWLKGDPPGTFVAQAAGSQRNDLRHGGRACLSDLAWMIQQWMKHGLIQKRCSERSVWLSKRVDRLFGFWGCMLTVPYSVLCLKTMRTKSCVLETRSHQGVQTCVEVQRMVSHLIPVKMQVCWKCHFYGTVKSPPAKTCTIWWGLWELFCHISHYQNHIAIYIYFFFYGKGLKVQCKYINANQIAYLYQTVRTNKHIYIYIMTLCRLDLHKDMICTYTIIWLLIQMSLHCEMYDWLSARPYMDRVADIAMMLQGLCCFICW